MLLRLWITASKVFVKIALCVSVWAGCWQPVCQRAVHILMHGAMSVIHNSTAVSILVSVRSFTANNNPLAYLHVRSAVHTDQLVVLIPLSL